MVTLHSGLKLFFMTVIEISLLFRTACQDHQAGECAVKGLSQRPTELRKWVLNRDRVDHEPGAITTRPRCRHFYKS